MAGAAAALPAVHVHEVYERVRGAIRDEHSAEIDPDEHAALVTAIVLHFQHGLGEPSSTARASPRTEWCRLGRKRPEIRTRAGLDFFDSCAAKASSPLPRRRPRFPR
jgi:hypothetical protein